VDPRKNEKDVLCAQLPSQKIKKKSSCNLQPPKPGKKTFL